MTAVDRQHNHGTHLQQTWNDILAARVAVTWRPPFELHDRQAKNGSDLQPWAASGRSKTNAVAAQLA